MVQVDFLVKLLYVGNISNVINNYKSFKTLFPPTPSKKIFLLNI